LVDDSRRFEQSPRGSVLWRVMTDALAQALQWWSPDAGTHPFASPSELLSAVERVRDTAYLVRTEDGAIAVGQGGDLYVAPHRRSDRDLPLIGVLPPLYPEWLGDRSFAETHGCRFPYVVGEMARGIATAEMVIAAAAAGLMGFFGSAGLRVASIVENIQHIQQTLGPSVHNWGANLIHSPQEPEVEQATVEAFLEHGVHRISASAFMALAPAVVRYMASGLHRDEGGRIRRRNHIFAKVSHPRVAEVFMAPPPEQMLRNLSAAGFISAQEAELAARLPVAEDITVEADSGGHTDNRPLTALFPTIVARRDILAERHGYDRNIRIGAAGGLGTPVGLAAALALGAAYVLTGSVNQAAVESGLSVDGRLMLAGAGIDDVAMAPAADMFEMGVKVQVLRRGTMFAVRAQSLYELYKTCSGFDDIPKAALERLERDVFRAPLEDIWDKTRTFFETRNPAEIERAEREPKHRMALVFRWYLFMGAHWTREVGNEDRRVDYQIWCGPAMGAFNEWTRGSFLEQVENRTVVQIGRNLLEGAAVITRAQQLRAFGVAIPPAAFGFRPRPLA
jgi:trans-AT polyketide synthase/acyltransferase/oxidoreductase domain-containing protein